MPEHFIEWIAILSSEDSAKPQRPSIVDEEAKCPPCEFVRARCEIPIVTVRTCTVGFRNIRQETVRAFKKISWQMMLGSDQPEDGLGVSSGPVDHAPKWFGETFIETQVQTDRISGHLPCSQLVAPSIVHAISRSASTDLSHSTIWPTMSRSGPSFPRRATNARLAECRLLQKPPSERSE